MKRSKDAKPQLSNAEYYVALEALNAALAGDPAEGDFCWNAHQIDAAERAVTKIKRLLERDADASHDPE
jgi:hypothetical protein